MPHLLVLYIYVIIIIIYCLFIYLFFFLDIYVAFQNVPNQYFGSLWGRPFGEDGSTGQEIKGKKYM